MNAGFPSRFSSANGFLQIFPECMDMEQAEAALREQSEDTERELSRILTARSSRGPVSPGTKSTKSTMESSTFSPVSSQNRSRGAAFSRGPERRRSPRTDHAGVIRASEDGAPSGGPEDRKDGPNNSPPGSHKKADEFIDQFFAGAGARRADTGDGGGDDN